MWLLLLLLVLLPAACDESPEEEGVTSVPPTPTATVDTAGLTPMAMTENFVTVATSAPYPPFEYFDEFGTVIGFDADVLNHVMAELGREYEFVVTNFDGLLDSVAAGEFDMAATPLITPVERPGLLYTDPYLEVGQVLVVLANERNLRTYSDLAPGMAIGVVANSFGQRAALENVGLLETDLQYYETVGQALQGLIDGRVQGVIIDHHDAVQFTETYFQQLKIAGGSGREAWISSQEYVMAVHAENETLYEELNNAIAAMRTEGVLDRLTRTWLVSSETIDAGESLVGTPDDVLVIGVSGQTAGVDPLAQPDVLGWEIKRNTMSGLLMYDAQGNLVPVLAENMPEISGDRREYTFVLRSGLAFADGTPLTADAVKWSIDRAAAGGNWHVNAFLKDDDGNLVADSDAVQVVGPNAVRIVLRAPASYFLSVLATPAYYVANPNCYAAGEEPAFACSGIGPYEIVEWEQNERLLLRANPQWPEGFTQPAVANVQLRFYPDAATMRNALEIEAIDMAWTGMPESVMNEMATAEGLRLWTGPVTFKSYLVFEQSEAPWDNPTVRQAVAYAVDREAIAAQVFNGRRTPLYSPVPDGVPGQVATMPARDLTEARSRLNFLGYTEENALEITLWYLNDGRYTALEELYAQALKAQLEETEIFQVTLQGAPWEVYSAQMSACEYPAFLLGWPPAGWPSRFPAAMGWMEYFLTNTDTLCSNFASPEMEALVTQLREADPLDFAAQEELYGQMQALWAEQYPTLPLTQEGPEALAWERVGNVVFDNMGLLFYELLTKAPAGEE